MKRIAFAAALLVAMAGADTLSIPLGEPAAMESNGYVRLLVQFDVGAIPESSFIYYAEIAAPCDLAETLALDVRRVTTAWQRGGVNWKSPWRSPRGDFDTTRTVISDFVPPRHDSLAIDVTSFVQDWIVTGSSRNFGLLLRPGLTADPGFVRYDGITWVLSHARVRVVYRPPAGLSGTRPTDLRHD